MVEAVDNPINIGSIVRNAVALGWDGMIFDYTSADPLSRRSLRVSMGQAIAFPAARSTRSCGRSRGTSSTRVHRLRAHAGRRR